MLKKTIVMTIALLLVVCLAVGCQKKEPAAPPPPADTAEVEPIETKTAEEHKAEADKQIDKDNMQSELDKLEQEVTGDVEAGE